MVSNNKAKEFYENVPSDWKISSLEDVVEFTNGKAHEKDIDPSGKYIVVNSKFISSDGVEYKRSNKLNSPLSKGDITLVMSDIPKGKALAKCFLVNENEKYTLNQRICSLRPLGDNEKYLYYFLNRNRYFINFDNGVGQTNLRKNEVLECPVLLPPLKEQQKIATILTSVDRAIEKTKQIIEQTEKVKKGLMQQLLTKGIGHTEFKESPVGRIPNSWETKTVGDLANIIRGASPRPKGDPRYYGGNVPRLMVADITRDKKYIYPSIDSLTEEGAKKSRPMRAGSLVMVCSGTVGIPGILAVDACIHDGFLGIKDISDECTTEYLFYAFSLLKNKLDSSATHGGVFTNLTTQILKDFIVTIPSIKEQYKIVNVLTIYDEKINLEEKRLQKLCNIKQGLMQQLLTGKVRVTINDSEEVPS